MEYKHANGYECLTKENFWDKIKADYPGEFEHFSKWIDEYKKKVKWDELLTTLFYTEINGVKAGQVGSIKYHDLPIAMQFGIFLEYVRAICGKHVMVTAILTRKSIAENTVALFASINHFQFHKSIDKPYDA